MIAPFVYMNHPDMVKDIPELVSEVPRYMNNIKLKAAGAELPLTKEQIIEMGKIYADPIYFIERYCQIVSIDHGFVPFKLYDYQRDLINLIHNNRQVIAKFPRQSGKTTTNAAYLLWYIIVNEVKTIGVLAHKASGAREVLERTKQMYESLPLWIQQGVKTWNKGSIELGNGCKVVAAATTSSAIRGLTINFLLLDEFAFIPTNNADEFFDSVYPTISSGKSSKISIFSTPKGMNHFWRMWTEATVGRMDGNKLVKSEFVPIEIKWNDIPGRDEAFKQKTINTIGIDSWNQEFACVVGESMVTIKCPISKQIFNVSMEDLLEMTEPKTFGVVYKIRRKDGLEYIGITINLKKRLANRRRSSRFKEIGIESVEVLFTGSYKHCELIEPYFIEKHDTYKNGLNITESGKGLSDTDKFNTFGYRYSAESRKKMSESAKKRDPSTFKCNWHYLEGEAREEFRKKLSEVRKGKISHSVFDNSNFSILYDSYTRWIETIQHDVSFLATYCKKTQRTKIESGVHIPLSMLRTSNGKRINLPLIYAAIFNSANNTGIKNERISQIIHYIEQGKYAI